MIMQKTSSLTRKQLQQKGELLHSVLIDVRYLAWHGESNHAANLADTFHNLPVDIYNDNFSWDSVCSQVLDYQKRHPQGPEGFKIIDYVKWLDTIRFSKQVA
jgi:hypothetical protein